MEPTPSESTMRLVRARARITEAADSVRAIVALDVIRWQALATRLAAPLFNPALDNEDLTVEDLYVEEAVRLAENVTSALVRLHRHLSTRVD